MRGQKKEPDPVRPDPCACGAWLDYATSMRPEDVNCAHVRAGGDRGTRAMISLHVDDVLLA